MDTNIDATAKPDGLPRPQRDIAIVVISAGVVAAVLDQAIANVALPVMAHALHTTPARSVWIVNAYQLAVVSTILPAAALGEIVGYRRVYGWGVAIFTLASLGCALSPSLAVLVAARVLQGLGAAAMMGVNAALIRFIYPRAILGRGIGYNALVVSTAATLGPSIASAILSIGSWPWLFGVNVPLGIAVLVGGHLLPATPLASHRLDLFSAALTALAFVCFFTGADGFVHGRDGWSFGAAALLVALVAGIAVCRRERASQRPLVPIDLLRRPVLALSVSASVCAFTATSIMLLTMPFFLQTQLHRSVVVTGLLMTAWPAALAAIALVSGRLSDRMSAAVLGGIGMGMLATALLLLGFMGPHSGNAGIAACMALAGIGMGTFQTPNNKTMLSSAPRDRAGAASGMLATARLFGLTLGATVAAFMLRYAPTHANHAGGLIATVLALLAAGLSLFRRAARPA